MPAWAFVAMFLVGSYIQYDENKKTAKRTQSAIEEGLRRQSEKTKERQQRVMDYAEETVGQQEQNERLAEAQEEQEQSIMGQISERMDAIPATESYSGSGYISPDAQKLANQSKLDTLNTLSELASLSSKTRGFTDLDFGNLMEEKGMAGDVSGIGTEADIMGRTDELLTKIASQPDARKMFAGGLLQQLGMMGAMNAMGTSAPAAAGTTTASAATVGPPIPAESPIYKTMLRPPARVGAPIPRYAPPNMIPIT